MWDLIVSVPDHCLSFYFTKCVMFAFFSTSVFNVGEGLDASQSLICLLISSSFFKRSCFNFFKYSSFICSSRSFRFLSLST